MTTDAAGHGRRARWGIGLAFAGAVIGMIVGWLSAVEFAGERDRAQLGEKHAQRSEAQAEQETAAAKDSLEALCAAGYRSACDAARAIDAQPDADDPELQELEVQEPEVQEPEIQEPEGPDPEQQDRETQDAEAQDPEQQDAEVQDGDPDDPEIQEPENQDPEIDDPDPDDPDPNDPGDQVTGVSCTFTGTGSLTITIQTSDGPVTTTCVGTGADPGPPRP